MSWTIAIPSYKRPEGVLKKTIATLLHYKVPPAKIYVFVESDQVAEYKAVIGSNARIMDRGKCANLGEARNAIIDHFPKGKQFIFMDDDVTGFKMVKAGKLVDIPSLLAVIKHGFDLCKKHGYHLWGVYPAANAFYMKSDVEYTTDLRFIVGAFMGIINQKITVNPKYIKEDYYLSIQYYLKDGGVIRFNKVAVKYGTKQPGGLSADIKRRLDKDKEACEFLKKSYPTLVRMNPQREGEILLNKAPKPISGGKAPPAVRRSADDADNNNTERKILPIRNKAKYEKAKAHLLDLLRQTNIPKLGKPGEGSTYNRARKLGSIGRTTTFGYGDTRQGIKEYATNRRHPELLRALAEFGNTVVPLGWDYNGITLNHGVKANKHKDTKNLGPSVIIGIGDFTGGDIRVWNAEDKDPKDIKLHDQPVMFNGGLLFHQTTPFKGERYTMIFYKQMWEGNVKGVKMEGSGIGGVSIKKSDFIKEHLNLLNILKIGTPAQRKKEAEDQAKELSGVLTGGIFA